jgi:hypothetical protein
MTNTPKEKMGSKKWSKEIGSEKNVIKLSSNTLLYQGVAGFPTRFRKQWVRFRPTFDSAGLDTVWTVGIDHQRG